MHAATKTPPETCENLASGDLVRIEPRRGAHGYTDVVKRGCIQLWADGIGQHMEVPVGSSALVVTIIDEAQRGPRIPTQIAEVLVDIPGLGPTMVSSFIDRLVPVEPCHD